MSKFKRKVWTLRTLAWLSRSRVLALLVLLMLSLISSGIVVHPVHAQPTFDMPSEPGSGTYEPLARAGLWSTKNFHSDYTVDLGDFFLHKVQSAAVYAGAGTKPMADVEEYIVVRCGADPAYYYNAVSAGINDWPYQIRDKTTGEFLSSTTATLPVPMIVGYSMELSAPDIWATEASAYFGVSPYMCGASAWKNGEGQSGGDPLSGAVSFTWSDPWPPLSIYLHASAMSWISTLPGAVYSSMASAVVDPYLYIDPESPLADQLQVYTLKAYNASMDDPSSWVPAVDPPVDFIPTTVTVNTSTGTVNRIGGETTKISGNLTSEGTELVGKTVELHRQYDSTAYRIPVPIYETWTHIADVSTGPGGYYEYDWNPEETLASGHYWIKAEYDGDVDHMQSSNTTDVDVIPPPDIAVTNVATSKTVVGRGYNVSIDVTVENHGQTTEIFNVTAYADTTEIEKQEITLTSGSSTTITLTWNTTDFAMGQYTIKAVADTLNETNISDNTFIGGIVQVTMQGDITADGEVNIQDLFDLGKAYASIPTMPNWKPNCDINNDGEIDNTDLSILNQNYGKINQ